MTQRIMLMSLLAASAGLLIFCSSKNGSNAMEPALQSTSTNSDPVAAPQIAGIPPIDLSAPQKFETATFALG